MLLSRTLKGNGKFFETAEVRDIEKGHKFGIFCRCCCCYHAELATGEPDACRLHCFDLYVQTWLTIMLFLSFHLNQRKCKWRTLAPSQSNALGKSGISNFALVGKKIRKNRPLSQPIRIQ